MLLGETLRLAREEKGQTISQVAESTRMMVQIVEDLEREDFRRIAAPIYGRGFIKLYAEHLGLDTEPLIREFMEIYTGSRPPQVARRSVDSSPDRPTAQPSDGPTDLPSDRLTAQPVHEPDLFSVAARRSEAVRAVPDPAQPPATVPPRVRPAHLEARPSVSVAPVTRRDPAAKRRETDVPETAGQGRGGAKRGLPLPWTPALIGAVAAVVFLLLMGMIALIRRKAGTTVHAKPAAIRVERVSRPSAPFIE